MRATTSLLLVVGVLLAGSAAARAAGDGAAPVAVAVKLFCKVVTYDEGLPEGTLSVGVVYPASLGARGAAAVRAFEGLRDMRVKGRVLEVVALPYSRPAELALARRGLYGLFVVHGTPDEDVPAIRAAARKLGLLTFAHDPSHVGLGLAVGVRETSEGRIILLNPGVALEEQRRFEGGFLSLCTITGT